MSAPHFFCIKTPLRLKIAPLLLLDMFQKHFLVVAARCRPPFSVLWLARALSSTNEGKVMSSAGEALAGVNLANATVAVGGFGTGGVAETLLHEVCW